MKVYFISDDSYFLLGVKMGVVRNVNVPIELINITKGINHFSPYPGDIVLIAIDDINQRESLMRSPSIINCRVILMVNIPIRPVKRRVYPWVIHKKTGLRELLLLINKAAITERHTDIVSEKVKHVFAFLGKGVHVNEVSEHFRTSDKYVYRVKRDLLIKYGVYRCNAIGILICRDVLYSALVRD